MLAAFVRYPFRPIEPGCGPFTAFFRHIDLYCWPHYVPERDLGPYAPPVSEARIAATDPDFHGVDPLISVAQNLSDAPTDAEAAPIVIDMATPLEAERAPRPQASPVLLGIPQLHRIH